MMKWVYIVVGVLLFLLIGKIINEYSFYDRDLNVEVIHSGVQP